MQKVRGAIDTVWQISFCRGRGWVTKGSDNPYAGDTLFLNDKDEVVIISQGASSNEAVVVREFKQTDTTALGYLVMAALKTNGLEVFSTPASNLKIRFEMAYSKAETGGYEAVVSVLNEVDDIKVLRTRFISKFSTQGEANSALTMIFGMLLVVVDLLGLNAKEDRDSLAIEIFT